MNIKSLHKWYDTLPEPRRFLTFFGPFAALWILGVFVSYWFWVPLLFVTVSRVHYIN